MAESDTFIQEVSEEVRKDKAYAIWRKVAPFLIGAVLLAVGWSAYTSWQEQAVAERKGELGSAMIEADAIDDPATAAQAFLDVAESGEYAYPVLARIRAAAALMQAGQLDEAEAQYEAVRDTVDADRRFRDLAELRIVMMRSETMDPAEMLDRLGPLTDDGSAWRLPALEFEAAAHIRAEAPEEAVRSLRAMLALPNVPPAAQGRATELIEAIEAQIPQDDAAAAPADDAEAEGGEDGDGEKTE